jgi:hypothetical protein
LPRYKKLAIGEDAAAIAAGRSTPCVKLSQQCCMQRWRSGNNRTCRAQVNHKRYADCRAAGWVLPESYQMMSQGEGIGGMSGQRDSKLDLLRSMYAVRISG